MTRTTTTTTPQPDVLELWAAHDRQEKEVEQLAAKHDELCAAIRNAGERCDRAFDAYLAAEARRRELFEVAYDATHGVKSTEPIRLTA